MSTLLADAVVELNLEPGQTYRTTVADYEVEVRRRAGRPAADEEPSQFADIVMLDPWFNLGDLPSPDWVTVVATVGEPMLPSRYIVDESDLAPE